MNKKENEYGYYVGLLLKSGSEMGMDCTPAILLTAELERLLNIILEEYLLPKSGRKIRDILALEGPCGTFFAQIELAYRLGIITEVIAHDLHIIREIRNRFAHGTHEMSFESEELKNKFEKMKMSKLKDSEGKTIKVRKVFQDLCYSLIDHLKDVRRKIERLTPCVNFDKVND